MATAYFNEKVKDQNTDIEMNIEFGVSNFYVGSEVRDGIGEDSIYFIVDGKNVTMNRKVAKQFVDAAQSLGTYYGFNE
ncbi:hypothetical protein NBRC116602_06940 [Hyphomicrobiales bacterium 4NK60-0047b]